MLLTTNRYWKKRRRLSIYCFGAPSIVISNDASSLSKALVNIDKTADGMKRRRQQFEKEVNGEDARLSGKIKKARTQM